jgi:predicted nucleotidyltransferase
MILEPAVALAEVSGILDSLSIRYFLVGSFASGFRGEFRATNDIDIVCEFTDNKIADFILATKLSFFADEVSIPERFRREASFNIIHEETFVKIDCFTKVTPLEEEQFSLASRLSIPSIDNCTVNVSTAEYNIIAKLNWYVKSNSVLERQVKDVKAMIEINREHLDYEYLRRWSTYFETGDLLKDIGCENI